MRKRGNKEMRANLAGEVLVSMYMSLRSFSNMSERVAVVIDLTQADSQSESDESR